MKRWMLFACLLVNFSALSSLYAHELSTSFISASVNTVGKLEGEIKLKILDLKDAIELDLNNNGELTWGEIEASQALIDDYITRNLSFTRNQNMCVLQLDNSMMLQQNTNVSYLVVPLSAQCETQGDLSINYRLLFDLFANHKAIVSLTDDQDEYLKVLTDSGQPAIFNVQSANGLQAFGEFVYQGIFHILIGLDHILFLLTLLLTVSLYRNNQTWQALESKTAIFKRTLWIVTSFTIAHSITLSGTALGIIPQFGSWIEVVIAASILFNVINNLNPLIVRLGLITFIFGLIHGMGFAGALAELGLPDDQKLLTVLAFNIGVELGQIALLLICLPLLITVRKSQLYARIIMPSLSFVIGVLAVYWIVTRL